MPRAGESDSERFEFVLMFIQRSEDGGILVRIGT